jgi:hypothetical protein
MSARRICFMHVGTGKAGSSALQYALASSRADLESRGYRFPNFGNMPRIESAQPTGGNAGLLWQYLRKRDVANAINLIRPLAQAPGHIVLSNENLHKTPRPTIRKFCAALRVVGYEPRALVFFRPQIEHTASAFFQHVKARGRQAPADMTNFATGRLVKDWYMYAQHLEMAFGRENLTVKWYPAVVRCDGVVKAAFDWLGLDVPSFDVPNINPTPGLEAFMVIQSLNQAGLGGRSFFDRFLAAARDQNLLGAKLALDTQTARDVYRMTKASNRKLLERYCPELSPNDELKPPARFKAPALDRSILERLSALAAAILAEEGADRVAIDRALGRSRLRETA